MTGAHLIFVYESDSTGHALAQCAKRAFIEAALRKNSSHESAVTVAVVGADTNSAKVSFTEPLQPTDCLCTRIAHSSGTKRSRGGG